MGADGLTSWLWDLRQAGSLRTPSSLHASLRKAPVVTGPATPLHLGEELKSPLQRTMLGTEGGPDERGENLFQSPRGACTVGLALKVKETMALRLNEPHDQLAWEEEMRERARPALTEFKNQT